jgi:predicted AlkP superfamily phosphohydrolase/phosphomutase
VLVIGLDGATWDLARPWADAGKLPNLARLLSLGGSANLLSTIPPISPAAWSSFMTGKNPGKHGVFDFTVRDFRGYGVRLTQRPSEPTLWGLASARQRQVCVVNVPLTYPPERVNGYMVTGLGTPSGARFTYPEELGQVLRHRGYEIDTDMTLQQDGPARFIEDVFRIAEQVTDTTLDLLAKQDWDLCVVVLRLTDEIPHFFWHWMDPTHPAHRPADALHQEAVLRTYQKADELVGKLIVGTCDRETTVFVVSDHGFGPLHKDVYLNTWLEQQGFLRMRRHPTTQVQVIQHLQRLGLTRTQVGRFLERRRLRWLRAALRDGLGQLGAAFPNDRQLHVKDLVDWTRTRAYSVGYIGQIFVNLAGRDPEGIVSQGSEYEKTVSELIESLAHMVDPADGLPVVDEVLRKEDLYSGTHLDDAPDLLVLMRGLTYITRHGYEFGSGGHVFVLPPTHETGGHRREGILLACGPGVAQNRWLGTARIEDLAPTILYLLGCDVPEDMDGRVLTELMEPELISARPVTYCDAGLEKDEPGSLTPEEEEKLQKHLRSLGYIG